MLALISWQPWFVQKCPRLLLRKKSWALMSWRHIVSSWTHLCDEYLKQIGWGCKKLDWNWKMDLSVGVFSKTLKIYMIWRETRVSWGGIGQLSSPVCNLLQRWVTVVYFGQLRNYRSVPWGLCCLSPCYILSLWGSPFLVVRIVVIASSPRACSALLCNWCSDESSGHLFTCLLTIWSSLQNKVQAFRLWQFLLSSRMLQS